MPAKLTQEEANAREGLLALRIREVLDQVHSYKELAALLKCGVQTIHACCVKRGIQIRKPKDLLLDRIQEELAMNPDRNRSMTDRARAVGIEYSHYYGLIRRHEIEVPTTNQPKLVDAVRALIAQGMYQAEIARKLGVKRQRVHEILKHYKLTPPPKAGPNVSRAKNTNHKAKKRTFKLLDEGVNLSRIAKICDVHYTTVLAYRTEWEKLRGRTSPTRNKPKADVGSGEVS